MTRRQMGLILTAVVLSSAISAAIAYHYGTRKRPAFRHDEAPTAANVPCVSYTKASTLVGNSSCVTGRVLKVFTSKAGNTYLDFCEDYRSCPFSSVIFSQDRTKFGDLTSLQGQFVEIRGLVSYYKERPQIIIRDPEQVKLRE